MIIQVRSYLLRFANSSDYIVSTTIWTHFLPFTILAAFNLNYAQFVQDEDFDLEETIADVKALPDQAMIDQVNTYTNLFSGVIEHEFENVGLLLASLIIFIPFRVEKSGR